MTTVHYGARQDSSGFLGNMKQSNHLFFVCFSFIIYYYHAIKTFFYLKDYNCAAYRVHGKDFFFKKNSLTKPLLQHFTSRLLISCGREGEESRILLVFGLFVHAKIQKCPNIIFMRRNIKTTRLCNCTALCPHCIGYCLLYTSDAADE